MKWVIAIALLMIVGSLGSALFFMMRDKSGGSRMIHSLMLRIGLSIALFAGIWIAHYFGLIEASGIQVGVR
jgi:Protein of unknown function (DUF2909)